MVYLSRIYTKSGDRGETGLRDLSGVGDGLGDGGGLDEDAETHGGLQ